MIFGFKIRTPSDRVDNPSRRTCNWHMFRQFFGGGFGLFNKRQMRFVNKNYEIHNIDNC
jgi:hypothetical protein